MLEHDVLCHRASGQGAEVTLEPQRAIQTAVDRKDRDCPRRLVDRGDRIKQIDLIEPFR